MKKYYIIAIALIILSGGYYWYSKSESSANETEYVTTAAQKGTLTTSVSSSGNITVDQLATVDPTISGTVANLSVKVGDQVHEGQVLFNIINDDLEVSVKKAESSYEQTKNSVESAKIAKDEAEANYDAAKKKDKSDPDSYTKEQLEVLDDKIDAAENKIFEAEKNLATSLASLQNEQANAAKRNVTAPISGTVIEINIKNGDDLGKINSGSTEKKSPLIIGDFNTLKAQVQVNEVDIPDVTLGQKVTLEFDAIDGFTATGKVESIDSLGTVSQNVVTYNVLAGLDEVDTRIKPEMSVSVSIITDVKQNVMTIPNGAIKTQGGSSYVEILGEGETTPKQVSVETGSSNNTDTEIVSGLKEGDKVVTQTINANSNTNSTKSTGLSLPGMGGGTRRLEGR